MGLAVSFVRQKVRQLFLFAEPVEEQMLDFGACGVGILTLENQGQFGSITSCQGHQVDEALGIDLPVTALHDDPALEFRGGFNQLGGGPQMKAQTVEDFHSFDDFHKHLQKSGR